MGDPQDEAKDQSEDSEVSSHETEHAGERLQKLLSRAGVASRRKAEQLIVEGRVTVNGKTVTELGTKADLSRDHIKVDGTLLHAPKHNVYIALNKPKNCVTTVADPEGRETVMHLMRGVRDRVFPVGRLDYQSEGLLLLTNDGEFAHRITSPSNHVTKVYVVKVNGPLTEGQEREFREGISMHGRKTAPAEIKLIKPGVNPWYEVKLAEGRQNQIRVMFQNFGRLVEKLRRVKIAFLELDVPPGRYRSLTPKEIERFKKLLKLDAN
jgi:23S rRNA pseudouridine2605 synthase